MPDLKEICSLTSNTRMLPLPKATTVPRDLPVALVSLMKMPMKALLPRKGLGALLAHSGVRMEGATTSVAYGTEGAQGDTWVVGFQ